jgi:single-stranded-DNA-specific exonuclease
MSGLFTRFGGHSGAAGLTIRASNAELFRKQFTEHAAARLSEEDRRPQFFVDAELPLEDLRERLVEQVLELGPFGFGNPAPVFQCKDVRVAAEPRPIGGEKHLSVPLQRNGRTIFAKAWNFGDRREMFRPGTLMDVLFQLEEDPMSRKRGYAGWNVSIRDVRARG